MWERFMEAGMGVYILWGVGAFGLLLKIIISVYLSGMVRASQDMSTTRKKSLAAIRQKLENRKCLVADLGSGEAFVNKNVYNLKCIGVPINAWKNLGSKLCLLVCILSSGAFLYYDVSWRGSPDMVYFMANAVLVCAFLMLIENIFLVTNKLELLKANIWDYLEMVKGGRKEGTPKRTASAEVPRNLPAEKSDFEKELDGAMQKAEVDAPLFDEAAAGSEEILNSFLKEFFT